MLPIPTQTHAYRICGIDPGTDTMGVCFIDLDVDTRKLTVIEASTYSAGRHTGLRDHLSETMGNRWVRLNRLSEILYRLLCTYRPHDVVVESPYLGRFVSAFEALVECRTMLSQTIRAYDPSLKMLLVDPPTAKLAVGAVVYKGSKENVRESLLALSEIGWHCDIDPRRLDEHSVDSVAVAIARAKALIKYWGG